MSNPAVLAWERSKVSQWAWQLGLSALLGVLFGCAADSAKPGAQASAAPPPLAASIPVTAEAAPSPLPAAISQPAAPFEGEGWQPLFDGRTLKGWRETAFAGHGEVECRSGVMLLNMGDPFTGVNWTNEFPTMDYEVALDAMRVMGTDFFCGLTVPVDESFCTFIVGGWGGSLAGISSIDGMDASENETTKFKQFETGRWYRIRLRLTEGRLEGWIDQEKLVDVVTKDKKISLRPGEIELSKPFGLAAWQTTAVLREIKVRRVSTPADPPRKFY